MRYQPWMRTWGRNGVVSILGMLLGFGALTSLAVAQPGEDGRPPHPPRGDVLGDPEGAEDGPPGMGDGRRGHGWRAGAMLWNRMDESERSSMLKFIAEEYPELYNRVFDGLDENDRVPGRLIGRILGDMIEMKELRDRDPELFKVHKDEQQTEIELRRLARRYQFANSDTDRKALASRIRVLVAKQFDIRQRRMEEDVKRLEDRVSKVREQIKKQADNRDAEIDLMLESILEKGPRGLDEMLRPEQPEGDDHDGRGNEDAKRRGGPRERRRPQ